MLLLYSSPAVSFFSPFPCFFKIFIVYLPSVTFLITETLMMARLKHIASSVWHLYYDGFRSMTVGRTLWVVILIKLFIIFAVLKLFFFPNYIHEHAQKGQEAEFVSSQILKK